METAPDAKTAPADRRLWAGAFVLFALFGLLFSIIQPLNRPPDEGAHAQYARFLATEHRFPQWVAEGGGEAGYEAQHPPLYYALGAAVYAAAGGLPERWRWHLLRWMTLGLGILLCFVARGFFRDYFRGNGAAALAGTAAFVLTPLTLLYCSYINVDALSLLLSSVVLWMCIRVARGEAERRDRALLAIAFGLGLLTKLTILGTLPVILAAHLSEPQGEGSARWGRRVLRLLPVLAAAALIAGWWYARNANLYGSAFIHTVAKVGPGLALADKTGNGGFLLWFTIRETYLSTWVQRGWLTPGVSEIGLYVILSGLILAAALLGAAGAARQRREAPAVDPAPWLCGLFLVTLVVGHQMQVWFVDYEFNAGGRYLLNGLMGVHALIVGGLARPRARQALWSVWVGVLLLMNITDAGRIWLDLNPRYAPGWRIFHFPPGEGDSAAAPAPYRQTTRVSSPRYGQMGRQAAQSTAPGPTPFITTLRLPGASAPVTTGLPSRHRLRNRTA